METKRCTSCGVEKPLDQYHKDSRRKDGKFPHCKSCKLAYEKQRSSIKKTQFRNSRRLRKYGIDVATYTLMANAQGNACALCKRPEPTREVLCVDHDHTTMVVRGLLCNNCNRALGLFKDSAEIITRAAEYLLKHGTSNTTASTDH